MSVSILQNQVLTEIIAEENKVGSLVGQKDTSKMSDVTVEQIANLVSELDSQLNTVENGGGNWYDQQFASNPTTNADLINLLADVENQVSGKPGVPTLLQAALDYQKTGDDSEMKNAISAMNGNGSFQTFYTDLQTLQGDI